MAFFIMLSLALIFWAIPTQIKVTAMMEAESFTPRSFPYLIAGGLLLVSVIGFFNNFLAYRKLLGQETEQAGEEPEEKKSRGEILFPYFIFALIVVYGLMFKFLGIVPATLVVPPVILWCLRCRKWQMYVAFFVFAAIIYLLFTKVLLVPIR